MKYLKFFGNSSEVGDGVNVETPNISYLYKTNTVFVSKRKGKNATIVYDQENGKIEYQPYEPVPLQSLSISGETNVMSTATYSVQYTPSYTFETGVTWSIVSGSEYASINPNTGVLTALSAASSSEVVIRATSIPNSAITAQKTLSVSYPSLQSISISGETNVGNTATYTVVYTPSNTPQKGVTWSIVSGSEYASINASTGVLTALSGASDSEVVIKATSAVNSGITDQKTLSVSYVVALQSISISGETDVTNSSVYSVQYTPSNTTQTGVTWSIISGSQYASINASTGTLTVLSGASSSVVIIKATSVVNSAITAQKTISVSYVVPLQSISISGETNVTGSTTYTVQYTPSNTTQTGVTWSIVSGSEYATINASTGLLTALYGASGSEVVVKTTSTVNSAITAQKTLSVSYPSAWYRICEGGIYTTTNAYINTGVKYIYENRLQALADVKNLQNVNGVRRIFGIIGNGVYFYAHFTGNSETSVYPNIFGFPGASKSDLTNIYNQSPFLNKKVRVFKEKRVSGKKDYIQVWTGNTLGNKVYSNYSISASIEITYPICFFNMNNGGSVNNSQCANYMVFYYAELIYDDITTMSLTACQLTADIDGSKAWDNKAHSAGEYGMYDSVSGKFFGNANSSGSFLENID